MQHRIAWFVVCLLMLAGCGVDRSGGSSPEPFPDATPPGQDAGGGNGSSQMDGGASSMGRDAGVLPDKDRAKVVSVAPPYGVAGETYAYSPKTDQAAETSWSVKSGPTGVTVDQDKGQVTWTPTDKQGGKSDVVIEGTSGDKTVVQEYEVTVALPDKQAEGKAYPGESKVVVVEEPGSDIKGASIKTAPSSLKEPTDLSVSKLDKTPPMNNVKGEPKAVQFGPSGTVFDEPAIVALPLPKDVLVNAGRAGAYVYNPQGRWERVPVVRVDSVASIVYARASHFSIYAAAEGSLELSASVVRMAESSACDGQLVAKGALASELSDIEAGSINNPSESIRSDIENGVDTVAALLGNPEFEGSLRFVRVFDLYQGRAFEQTLVERRALVTTMYLSGRGDAVVTHSDALGNALETRSYVNAEASLKEISGHLRGQYTHARFAHESADDLAIAMRMHVIYYAGDASFEPVSLDDLGLAFAETPISVPSVPETGTNFDVDCDGLDSAVDTKDDRLLPTIVAAPEQLVTFVAGGRARLSARVRNVENAPPVSFAVLAGEALLEGVAGDDNARDFSTNTSGRYLVEARATVEGQELSHVFALEVLPRPRAIEPPSCDLTADLSTLKVGEAVALLANARSQSVPEASLTVEWGIVDRRTQPASLAPDASLVAFQKSARLTPSSAGLFVVGCRAFDGVSFGPIKAVNIDVLPALSNRPPFDFVLSPPAVTLFVGQAIVLSASAHDLDGDALTFTWPSLLQLTGRSDSATSSAITFNANAPGPFEIRASVTDGKSAPIELVTKVLVVAGQESLKAPDADNDGWPAGALGTGLDCDDANPSVRPNATDDCSDALDNDCDGSARTSDCDGDGFTTQDGDCDDADPRRNPKASERCDGIDNDCDGAADDGYAVNNQCSVGLGACVATGALGCARDGVNLVCDARRIDPVPEICNGVDDDCNGVVPENERDADEDGTPICRGDCNDQNRTIRPGVVDLCDGIDNDCDGQVDEDFVGADTTCGEGACARAGRTSCVLGRVTDSCAAGQAAQSDTTCDGRDDDCDGRTDEEYEASACNTGKPGECAPGMNACVQGALRCNQTNQAAQSDTICNGRDDDCDGSVDEEYASIACTTERLGACAGGTTSCVQGASQCVQTEKAAEADVTCDGIDNDCDGRVDEEYVSTGCSTNRKGVCAAGATSCVQGEAACNQTAQPSANDASCNGLDDDCDGQVDEEYASVVCPTGRLGVCAAGTTSCVRGEPACIQTTEASPSDATCDNRDDDCDGQVDEEYTAAACNTGKLGVCAAGTMSCVSGTARCNQTNEAAASDTTCNGLDEDCSGVADEDFVGAMTVCGKGACGNEGSTSCRSGKVEDSCAPLPPAANDASCDGVDDDCDGLFDEDYASTTCNTDRLGVCAEGTTSCANGSTQCNQTSSAAPIDTSCNGIDEDCNGVADEDYVSIACDTGNKGLCAAGMTSCAGGRTSCSQTNTAAPNDTTCDGIDNDCSGQIDEDYVSLGCTTDKLGACAAGTTSCSNGVASCNQTNAAAPSDTTCDGIDNDCSGEVDEDYVSIGCTTNNFGICAAGTTSCLRGSAQCDQTNTAQASDATCNGLDDDCNGEVDEDYAAVDCDTGKKGICAPGTQVCIGGSLSCVQNSAPAPDDVTCNQIDDDCNGQVDDGFPITETKCGVGACNAAGMRICSNGLITDTCSPGTPQPEICDNIDNNCDGEVDEGQSGNACLTTGKGRCSQGVTACMAGVSSCNWLNEPLQETCNSIDDDCDGQVDEGIAPEPCNTGLEGVCSEGTTTCEGGIAGCLQTVQAALNDSSCDGIDQDCDGTSDDDFVSTTTSCGVGGCANTGESSCAEGILHTNCVPHVAAEDDSLCNGIDDDCDEDVDEDFQSYRCETQNPGQCAFGMELCVEGKQFCQPDNEPAQAEECNGLDDDCDGQTPENEGDLDGDGFRMCQGDCDDSIAAVNPLAKADPCDGHNDDCDLETDEDFVPGSCVTGQLGVCEAGYLACRASETGASVVCLRSVNPGRELCNALDDDCDGIVPAVELDDDKDGFVECTAEAPDCNDANTTIHPGAPDPCNGIDDDCDGTNDEDFAGGSCITGEPGLCSAGSLECKGTGVSCARNQGPLPEVCNNVDDNCDGMTDEGGVCCTATGPELCGNGLDDDCDGLVDAADTAECPAADRCVTAQAIGPGTYSDTLVGYQNDWNTSCLSPGAVDRFYRVTVPAGNSRISVTLSGASRPLGFSLLTGTCGAGQGEVACVPGGGTATVGGPGDYFVVVEGAPPGAPFTMTLSFSP